MAGNVTQVTIGGIPLASVTFEEALDSLERFITEGTPHLVCTVNVNQVYAFRKDADFRRAYRRASLLLCDGRPLLWTSHLLGRPLPAHIPGSRLLPAFAERAAERGYRLYFLGAAPGVAAKAARLLEARYPGLQVVECYSPPFGFEKDPVENERTLERVRKARPDALFVAFGAPKQEKWLAQHLEELQVPVMVGIGSTFDSLANRGTPAPDWATNHGLEWFYRLALEPRRLWKRYLLENTRVLPYLILQILAARCARRGAPS